MTGDPLCSMEDTGVRHCSCSGGENTWTSQPLVPRRDRQGEHRSLAKRPLLEMTGPDHVSSLPHG